MEIGFRWDFAYEILPTLIRATGNTILAAGIGYLIAVLVGLVFLDQMLSWKKYKVG